MDIFIVTGPSLGGTKKIKYSSIEFKNSKISEFEYTYALFKYTNKVSNKHA